MDRFQFYSSPLPYTITLPHFTYNYDIIMPTQDSVCLFHRTVCVCVFVSQDSMFVSQDCVFVCLFHRTVCLCVCFTGQYVFVSQDSVCLFHRTVCLCVCFTGQYVFVSQDSVCLFHRMVCVCVFVSQDSMCLFHRTVCLFHRTVCVCVFVSQDSMCLFHRTVGIVSPCRLAENSSPPLKFTFTPMHGVGGEPVQKAFQVFGHKAFVPVVEQMDPDPEFPTVSFPNPEEGKSALVRPGKKYIQPSLPPFHSKQNERKILKNHEVILLSHPSLHKKKSYLLFYKLILLQDLAIQTANAAGSVVILATDPDADRLALAEKDPATGRWKIFSGNEIGALLSWWALKTYRDTHPDFDGTALFFPGDFHLST